MDNKELIQNFMGLCKEIYKIPNSDYKTIIFLIDNIEKISNNDLTDKIVKEHCKEVYCILRDHDLWPIFIRILKNANKYVAYRIIVNDGRYYF